MDDNFMAALSLAGALIMLGVYIRRSKGKVGAMLYWRLESLMKLRPGQLVTALFWLTLVGWVAVWFLIGEERREELKQYLSDHGPWHEVWKSGGETTPSPDQPGTQQ